MGAINVKEIKFPTENAFILYSLFKEVIKSQKRTKKPNLVLPLGS